MLYQHLVGPGGSLNLVASAIPMICRYYVSTTLMLQICWSTNIRPMCQVYLSANNNNHWVCRCWFGTGRNITGPCHAEVENKQLSHWDLGLLEMYGKNNNSNRKSIFRHIAGLAGNPSQLPVVAAASNSCRKKSPIKYTIGNCKCKMVSSKRHHCWLYRRCVVCIDCMLT